MLRRLWFLDNTDRPAMLPKVPTNTIKAHRNDSPTADDKEREASCSSRDDPKTVDEEDIFPASHCSQL